jgi:hypothetical protein
LYPSGTALFAAPFDLKTLTVGAARPVADGLIGVLAGVAVSRAGTIAYYGGDTQATADDSALVWVARDGGEQRLPEPPHGYGDVQISPDGRQVATNIFEVRSLALDLWTYDLEADRLTKLTFGGANAGDVWTPDGRRLFYSHADSLVGLLTGGGELRSVPVDQSAAPVLVLAMSDRGTFLPSSISPDGAVLAGTFGLAGARDVAMLTLNEGTLVGSEGPVGEPRDFLATTFDEQWPTFSPDGRYVAYSSNEQDRTEVYVVPYPGPGGKTQVSRGGGDFPQWNPAGGELFYVSAGNELMATAVETTGAFRASTPRALFAMPPVVTGRGQTYDVAADGTRFLVRKQNTAEGQWGELRVVVNLIGEIERGAVPRP